jgi:hypothetical protein
MRANRPMFNKSVSIILLLTSFHLLSCNYRLVKNEDAVYKKTGVIVFVDRDSVTYADRNGDVFTDSLLPDIFIPYQFKKNAISRKDLEELIAGSNEAKVSFCYLSPDCNNVERESYIKVESLAFVFDRNVDSYIHSPKLYFLPVEIKFIKSNISREYSGLHQDLTLVYKGKTLKLLFKDGTYEILQLGVIQNDWVK